MRPPEKKLSMLRIGPLWFTGAYGLDEQAVSDAAKRTSAEIKRIMRPILNVVSGIKREEAVAVADLPQDVRSPTGSLRGEPVRGMIRRQ